MHAYLWPSAENFRRARELGVFASIQPGMQWRVAGSLAGRFGVEGAAAASPLRSWLDAGVEVAGGSDGPDFPGAPLFGMYQARSRAAQGFDEPLGPEEAIDGERALAMWTTSAARYCFAEGERGALRPGLLADWAALSVDPVECEPEALREAAVLQTALAGTRGPRGVTMALSLHDEEILRRRVYGLVDDELARRAPRASLRPPLAAR